MIQPVTMPEWGLSTERGRMRRVIAAAGEEVPVGGTLLDTLLDGDAQAIDAAPLLSEVDVPTTTIWAGQDAVLPPGNADVYVENAGHLVHLEVPGAVLTAITG
ncbi:hypothetical protein Amsp01_069690 [Amycolatopsis sp. NBRC 101858]|uniref:hypothetical protein n=1 Tax=Amycolatopsis sp. NBRC 101858 TaxID=3032200 RepID=UPI0024A52C0D|nr:hypothetical protein [Amycolatopsis sp. NBRC 101858]GLY40946.1 hypothetical protein Amsp01_069690 [Amycolatopsis sp. NBRC 101858]